ncbi:3-ketoacyl-ACP reductase [Bauldia sp.]|uniref:3-ketoacyl-ACP reductase n=1 Tax=Bauldia sp. TaxID=2575872 RepID=UPI003BAD9B1E
MGDRRVALVTGGRRGIGRGIACALAEAGFDVVVNDIVADSEVDTTLATISKLGASGVFAEADITDLSTHESLIDGVYAAFGRFDCLVNNAGVMAVRGDLLEGAPEDFDRVMAINLRAPFFLTQATGRRMLAEDDKRDGRSIVTISSVNAVMVSPEKNAYCISKSALPMMTQMFAMRLGEHGIACYEVRPGFIKTDINIAVRDVFSARIEAGETHIRRWGETEDVGRAVASLAAGALPYTTGHAVYVDGGLGLHRL